MLWVACAPQFCSTTNFCYLKLSLMHPFMFVELVSLALKAHESLFLDLSGLGMISGTLVSGEQGEDQD